MSYKPCCNYRLTLSAQVLAQRAAYCSASVFLRRRPYFASWRYSVLRSMPRRAAASDMVRAVCTTAISLAGKPSAPVGPGEPGEPVAAESAGRYERACSSKPEAAAADSAGE